MAIEPAATIWFTGMPRAGKSTLARSLVSELHAQNLKVELLDGDVVRQTLSDELGYAKKDRDRNVKRIGFVCQLLSRNGIFAVAAAISPYRDARREVRQMHESVPFVEVYASCPLADLIKRDQRGIYDRALRGEIPHFTGVSDPYEPPENPEIVVQTNLETQDQSLGRILCWLYRAGHLPELPVRFGHLASGIPMLP